MEILWTALLVAFLILEAVTTQFVCIWFAGGAFLSLIATLLRLNTTIQICTFVLGSAILLVFTRKIVDKLKSKDDTKTNVDALIGQLGVVTADISNIDSKGTVKLRGMEWSARSSDGEPIEKDSHVRVKEIDGVKLIVDKIPE